MKDKKGFTLVELIIVIALLTTIAGIFSFNMINSLRKQKEDANENVIAQIKSAANAYVTNNPEEIDNLYNGYGYVDIPIGDLRNEGLLSEDIKDSETGEIIPDDEKVRVKLDTGDYLDFDYPAKKPTDAWKFVSEEINIDYDSKYVGDWCKIDETDKTKSNVYNGLVTNPLSGNYSTWKSKMYLMNKESKMYDKDYFDPNTINLRVTSCNVNPAQVGTYNITYKYIDIDLNTEKTVNRIVHVNSSNEDVVAFSVIINKGSSIVRGTKEETVPILIKEIYRNGAKDFETTVGGLKDIGYEITNFNTQVVGNDYIARVSRIKSNSDGSIPDSQQVKYVVIPDTYTLTFNPNNGTVGTKSIIVTYMKPYGNLPSPSRTGYDFSGWYTDSSNGTKVTSNTIMDKLYDHTLYAHWSPKKFTVSFNGNGGSTPTSSKTVTYDSTYGTLPTPSKTGYNFSGWYTSSSGGSRITNSTKVTILSNQTLYAHWSPKTFTVYFNAGSGSVSQTSKTVTYDSTYGTLPSAYHSGYYYFSGWTGPNGSVSSSTRVTITSDVTLTANYYYSPPPPPPPTPTYTPSRPTTTTKPSTTTSNTSGTTPKPTPTTTTKVIIQTEEICDAKCQMMNNSQSWRDLQNDKSISSSVRKQEQDKLHQQNIELAKQVGQNLTFKSDGSWYQDNGSKFYTSNDAIKTTTKTTTKTVTCSGRKC